MAAVLCLSHTIIYGTQSLITMLCYCCVPTIPAGDKPTLQLLNCFKYNDVSGASQHKIFIIDRVGTRWKRLGLALNISDYHLDNIEHSSHRNVEEWCLTMLSDWLRGRAGDGPVTWERLVEAMEDARCGELAQQVKTALQLCCCATGTSL